MNTASALIKQVLELQDFETWSNLRKHYLPTEYHAIYTAIFKHSEKYFKLPTFEDLTLEIRDSATKEKLLAIESIEVDVDAYMLLEYLKNEYTEGEILDSLEKYIENSISFEDAEESVSHLHQIVLDIEDKVELDDPSESMQRISLFETEEELARYITLGLNAEYDEIQKFSPTDLILFGGKRGAGKSLTCSNIANKMYDTGRSVLYFTIEMPAVQILQRSCAIATDIPFSRIRQKQLSVIEWGKVAAWFAGRFQDSEEILFEYFKHNDFTKFHQTLTSKCMLKPRNQLDIIYEPGLTLAKIESEAHKKVQAMDVGLIIVDYINQVKRSAVPHHRSGQYDWTEQIEVSKALKGLAQRFKVPVVAPYQTDASGEARFAKGILDAADAAFTLNAHNKADNCVSFDCVKMRNAEELSFTSKMEWDTLRMGPESAELPREDGEESTKTGEDIQDI